MVVRLSILVFCLVVSLFKPEEAYAQLECDSAGLNVYLCEVAQKHGSHYHWIVEPSSLGKTYPVPNFEDDDTLRGFSCNPFPPAIIDGVAIHETHKGKVNAAITYAPGWPPEVKKAEVQCKSVGGPTMLACGSYFLGCPVGCGHSPYILTWTAENSTSYQVQHKLFGSWQSYYSGSSTSTLASTGTLWSEQFRVRGKKNGISSEWCTMWISVQCSDTQDPW